MTNGTVAGNDVEPIIRLSSSSTFVVVVVEDGYGANEDEDLFGDSLVPFGIAVTLVEAE
jgi:hypothetical protein